MHITVNASDELPIYRQIMRQILEAIAGGRIAPGEKLPSHRELSEQIVVAPLTVKKAYDDLEAQGYIETRRGLGTFVAVRPPRQSVAAQKLQLMNAARALLARAYLTGLTMDDLVALLHEADQTLSNETATARTGARRR